MTEDNGVDLEFSAKKLVIYLMKKGRDTPLNIKHELNISRQRVLQLTDKLVKHGIISYQDNEEGNKVLVLNREAICKTRSMDVAKKLIEVICIGMFSSVALAFIYNQFYLILGSSFMAIFVMSYIFYMTLTDQDTINITARKQNPSAIPIVKKVKLKGFASILLSKTSEYIPWVHKG